MRPGLSLTWGMRQWVTVMAQMRLESGVSIMSRWNGILPEAQRWHMPISSAVPQTDAIVVTKASCRIWALDGYLAAAVEERGHRGSAVSVRSEADHHPSAPH